MTAHAIPDQKHSLDEPQGQATPPYEATATLPPAYDDNIHTTETNNNTAVDRENAATPNLPKRPSFGERFHRVSSKAGWPLNKAANAVGAEGIWPSTMDKECLKAARILYSFTGLDKSSQPPTTNGPLHPTGLTAKSMAKIPPRVLQNCYGIAIFNVLRGGLWHGSLSGGSGLVLARRSDGTWSPPSAFVVSSLGAGFMFGLDVYDCVCVLNTPAQVDAFTRPRVSLGGGASIAVGPVGGGASVEAAVNKPARPIWSYIKSRGLWVGMQVDGTVMLARREANALFYGEKGITAERILLGDDVAWPLGAKALFEVLRAVDGRGNVDRAVVEEMNSVPVEGEASILGEKATMSATAVERGDLDDNEQRRDQSEDKEDDLYSVSAADEKERLAKSGY